jgi:glycosyltransferase involved in cell wall biosynthesis
VIDARLSPSEPPSPVSFVVPVRNGARWIRDVLHGIARQRDGRPFEIIVVDDRSADGTAAILRELAWPDVRVITGPGRGAAAAVNAGIRAARFPVICQVDQDVVLEAGWLRCLTAALQDPRVAAAQGRYVTDRDADLASRVMGFDLEQRYGALRRGRTSHVCTGNAAYRADALWRAGLFDETLGYGYDNDMSYRLQHAGYRLVYCPDARSAHRWREGLRGYWLQQYGFGYGRLDLVAKHPARAGGDSVSPLQMMLHPIVMAIALVALVAAITMADVGGPTRELFTVTAVLIAALAIERTIAGVRGARTFRSGTPLLFPLFHLLRDAAWVSAIATWTLRRLVGGRSTPSNSMVPRPVPPGDASAEPAGRLGRLSSVPTRILGLIPAHNEAATLADVVADVRANHPDLDLLVIDDGSTDETPDLIEALAIRWIRLPERMGIGSAMRAGLRYAARRGYDAAVRLDGDGQHRASDIGLMLAPLREGRADVVLGSRYTVSDANTALAIRLVQRTLSFCLRMLTGRIVTDPTSGFCALGPRAVRLLAEHHPTGYPEPELRLFLDRSGLRVVEVPVNARSRQGGRTSLTPFRLTAAGARVLLAMIIVPFRSDVWRADRD